MIRTRRSFLQRVKERSKQEYSPLRKNNRDLDWARSNDDIDVFSDHDNGSTGSCEELIVCPPTTERNSARDAAEALRQDLEDMGYNLDCKSFITKGSMESESVFVERYQPPRKIKPKASSSSASSASAPGSVVPEKDIIMSMRSLVTTPSYTEDVAGKADTKAPTPVFPQTSREASNGSKHSHVSDWENTDKIKQSDWVDEAMLDSEATQATSTEGQSIVNTAEAVVYAPSAPVSETSFGTYDGSLKKIVTVPAVASYNETTISNLKELVNKKQSDEENVKRSSSNKDADDDVVEKNEHSAVSSANSKSTTSYPISTRTPPVPDTLNVPVRKHVSKQDETHKAPVLIEGMSFVKNTTLAPESARNSNLSPRTRHARAKLRKLIQEKMEQNQEAEIASAKTAPAMLSTPFFSEKRERLVNEKTKVNDDKPEAVPVDDCHEDTKETSQQGRDDNIAEKVSEEEVCCSGEKQNDSPSTFHDISPIAEDQNEESSVKKAPSADSVKPYSETDGNASLVKDNTPSDSPVSKRATEEKVVKSLTSLDAKKGPTKKKKKQSHLLESPRRFRPLSVFRKPSVSPQKKRKPLSKNAESKAKTPEPKVTRKVVAELPKLVEKEDMKEKESNEECAYVGYDIETNDGVEVIAVAKSLPYVAPGSPIANKKLLSSPSHSQQSKSEVKFEVSITEPIQKEEADGEVIHQEDVAAKKSTETSSHPAECSNETSGPDDNYAWNMVSSFFSKSLVASSNVLPKFEVKKDESNAERLHEYQSTEEKKEGPPNSNVEPDVEVAAEEDQTLTGSSPPFSNDDSADPPTDKTDLPTELPICSKQTDLPTELPICSKQTDLKKDAAIPTALAPIVNPTSANTKKLQKKTPREKLSGKEAAPKWKTFRKGFKSLRKSAGFHAAKAKDQPKDRHEIIQDFLDNELQGQEEHSFPSKLDPSKNPHGASLLQDMMHSTIPKQLVISKIDDSSCITSDTERNKASWQLKSQVSPSSLDAAIWDEIAEAAIIVEKAILDLEGANKKSDASTRAGSTISREIEKSLLTLKRHADRLGVTETDLLLAIKSTDGCDSDHKAAKSGDNLTDNSTTSSAGTSQSPSFGPDMFMAMIQGYFMKP